MTYDKTRKASALYDVGGQSLRMGRFAEAITILRLVIGMDPKHADAHAALCVAAHEEGEHDLIHISTMQLFDLPNRGAIQRAEAVGYYDSGFYEEAVATISESIQLCPHEALGYYILGRSQLALFSFNEAQASFLKACELAPDFAVVRSLLTWLTTYLSIGESERMPLLVNTPRVPLHQPPPDIREMTKYSFTPDSLEDLYGNVGIFLGVGKEL